jgi:hypothetical protein
MHWRSRYHPLVPITLGANGQETLTYAILDSGADATLLHASIAEDLGIEIESGTPTEITGIKPDEPIAGFTHTLDVRIGGVALGLVSVDFSDEIDDDWTDQLIGRHMIFDRLKIGFRQSVKSGFVYLAPEGRSILL